MKVRFSLYQRSSHDDTYYVHPVLGLTKWKSSSAILGAVELIPYGEDTPGCYKLHDTSSKHLREMGYVCRGEVELGTDSASSETVLEDPIDDNQLPDDFYEIEDVLEQRLCHKTLTYEYRVRFKGYSSEDDMWLPASYFNRAINFESLSKSGRKRKHKIDPDAAQELPNKKRKTSINEEKQGLATAKSANRKKRTAKSEKKLEERNKGKVFRSTLPPNLDPNSATSKTSGLLKSGDGKKLTETKDVMSVIDVEDNPSDEIPLDFGLLSELLRQDDNFRYPRRLLAEASFPKVNATLTSYTVGSSGSAMMDPITVKELPPQSVLNEIKKEFATSQNVASQLVAKINSFGDFNMDGIRILERFHRLKRLRAEVSFEKKWIKTVFRKNPFEEEVTHALLNRWNLEGSYLASYGNYRITSQELSLLCGERYLSDEILNFLGHKFCERANDEHQACLNILLPSFLSSGNIINSVVSKICVSHDMASVVQMFLPVHMQNECHWGLAIFSVRECKVFFDDGYHYPVPEELKRNATDIMDIIYQTTSNDNFHPSKWCQIERFKVPMPDQPSSSRGTTTGCGSCGVAVICSIRDICNGVTNEFTWSYKDTPRLRAELILEVLDLFT